MNYNFDILILDLAEFKFKISKVYNIGFYRENIRVCGKLKTYIILKLSYIGTNLILLHFLKDGLLIKELLRNHNK